MKTFFRPESNQKRERKVDTAGKEKLPHPDPAPAQKRRVLHPDGYPAERTAEGNGRHRFPEGKPLGADTADAHLQKREKITPARDHPKIGTDRRKKNGKTAYDRHSANAAKHTSDKTISERRWRGRGARGNFLRTGRKDPSADHPGQDRRQKLTAPERQSDPPAPEKIPPDPRTKGGACEKAGAEDPAACLF